MQVTVHVAEGEDLTIGIKTGNKRNNGVRSTNDNAGWFKVDYFRIHKIDPEGQTTSVSAPRTSWRGGEGAVYDLQGRQLTSINRPGVYIVEGKKVLR
jgi:hypothetical protein